MAELVTLDGHPLTGTDRNGAWKVNSIPGWWERPAVKRRGESRPRGDGSYQTPILYDNRLITINGRVSSKSHDYMHQAERTLNALCLRGGAPMLVRGHGTTQWAAVDPRGTPSIDFVTDRFLQYQIPLEAIDPFKYGEEHRVVGSPAVLFHRGTVPAWPVVRVTGSGAGYTLTLNGRSVTVTRYLNAGVPHVIDFRTGILRVGGAVERGGLSAANFSPINPGLPQSMTTTLGTITVTYHDTFI